MTTMTVSLPAMYGDHHVAEVRRLLLALPGVQDVYASSAFQAAEVTFDPAQIQPASIEKTLGEAGYLGELALPVESGKPVTESNGSAKYFRHTAVYTQAGRTVGFGQVVANEGRPLWPCPGMGPVARMDE